MTSDLHILYLHGFLSAPQSKKAQQTIAYCGQKGMADRIHVPALMQGPAATIHKLSELIRSLPGNSLGLIGSSLGGYYATYLAEAFHLPAVLINPAVGPLEFWESHLGEHKNYYSDHLHVVTPRYIEELRSLERNLLQYPENFMVMVQTGDETLDYRKAVSKFSDSRLVIRENGDHSYQGYDRELPDIEAFLLSRINDTAR
ncbi:MAG: esterase YqiA [Gammaproteobacteria bacterium]|nr:esterase YqiA [Gammaproteobacteria bacterium]